LSCQSKKSPPLLPPPLITLWERERERERERVIAVKLVFAVAIWLKLDDCIGLIYCACPK
jgi:hypothetical protein